MNRRGFFKALGAVVGGIALEQAIPFNRVWSFPKNIVIAQPKVIQATIGQYYDYMTFSNLALAALLDAVVDDARKEAAKQYSDELKKMIPYYDRKRVAQLNRLAFA